MSAFIVSKAHIDALVRVAMEGPRDAERGRNQSWYRPRWTRENGAWSEMIESSPYNDEDFALAPEYVTPNALGRMLWGENRRSVAYRYPDDTEGALPGPIDLDHEDIALYRYDWASRRLTLTGVAALKAIRCLEYQSCEHPQWEKSEAKQALDALTRSILSSLPGYEDAAWEITNATVAA